MNKIIVAALVVSCSARAWAGPHQGVAGESTGSIYALMGPSYTKAKASGRKPALGAILGFFPPIVHGSDERWAIRFDLGNDLDYANRYLCYKYENGVVAKTVLQQGNDKCFKEVAPACEPIDGSFLDAPDLQKALVVNHVRPNGSGQYWAWLVHPKDIDCARDTEMGSFKLPRGPWPDVVIGRSLWVVNNDKELVFLDAHNGALLYRGALKR